MKTFQVPQKQQEVLVRLRGGEELAGSFYFAARGPGGSPGRLSDRLNDRTEKFLPLAYQSGAYLLNKDAILSVRLDSPGADIPSEGAEHHAPVRVRLVDGGELEGYFDFSMPVGRERVVDFLNAAPRFVALTGRQTTTLVNTDGIRVIEGSDD